MVFHDLIADGYRPVRLYCPTCEETYSLPQNGAIKVPPSLRLMLLVYVSLSSGFFQLYKELTCPLDGFELVLFSLGSGAKSYPVCPYCYNIPQIEGQKKGPYSCALQQNR